MGQNLKQVTAIRSSASTSQEEDRLLQTTTSPTSLCGEPSASQTFSLANGDMIGYSTCGPACAPAIFLLHGHPGSRIDGLFFHSLAEKVGARIICPDRPGLGLSTLLEYDFQHSAASAASLSNTLHHYYRKLLGYPDTSAQLAQHLGLNSYRILGWSSGGSFALACVKTLPKEQLVRVGVLVGMGPADAGSDGMRPMNKFLLRFTSWFPRLVRLLLEWTLVRKAQNPDPEVLRSYMKAQMKTVRGQEKKDMEEMLATNPDAMEIMSENIRQHFRQGADGFIREVQIVMEPWGFNMEDVEAEVMLWYGTADINVPVRVGREMAKRLKRAELKEYAGETHFTIHVHHGQEILTDFLKD